MNMFPPLLPPLLPSRRPNKVPRSETKVTVKWAPMLWSSLETCTESGFRDHRSFRAAATSSARELTANGPTVRRTDGSCDPKSG